MNPGIEIHIVPDSQAEKTSGGIPKKRLSWLSKRILSLYFSLKDFGKTVLTLVLATAISFGLRELNLGDQNIIMVYLLSILVISRVTVGYLYGICASVFGVLLFNFFFT